MNPEKSSLVWFSAGSGLIFGLEACAAFECSGLSRQVTAGALGGAGMAGVAWFVAPDAIDASAVSLVESGVLWGGWLAGGLSTRFRPEDASSAWARALGGHGIGLASGAAIARLVRPRPASVMLANSAGVWAGVFALLGASAARWRIPDEALVPVIGANALGIAGGAIAAHYFDVDDRRIYAANVAGVLGIALGLAVDLLVQGAHPTNEGFFLSGAGGAAVGLLAGALIR